MAQRAKVFVIVQPFQVNVSAITIGATDLIEVDDSGPFDPADSIRVRNGDGTLTEIATIIAITVGTGPGGDDELEVATLTNAYTPATDDVDVLQRITIAKDTELTTDVGVTFALLDAVTTGDANPILDGEGTFVGLADKQFAEATQAGAVGQIDPQTVTGFATPLPKVKGVFNPEPSTGGTDSETDFDLKYRTAHMPTIANQETLVWLEALAKAGNSDVLRAVRTTTSTAGTMAIKVLRRNGGNFSAAELTSIEQYVDDRVRSFMVTAASNLTLTSVEVDAEVTLEPGAVLETVWKEASNRLAEFLDFRKWDFGEDVDEADLLGIVNNTPGVATLSTGTFLPAADVAVGAESLPHFTRLSLKDLTSGNTCNATLSTVF